MTATKPRAPPVPVSVAAATRWPGRVTARRVPAPTSASAARAREPILTPSGMDSQVSATRLTAASTMSRVAAAESR